MPLNNFIDALKTTISSSKKKTIVFSLSAAVLLCGFFVYNAYAGATIIPASGGTNISIDTTSAPEGSGTFKTLSGPTISESAAGDIAAGVHIITLPTGWEFDTTSTVTVFRTAGNIEPESQVVTPGTNSFTFTITNASTDKSSLAFMFSSMKVRPAGTTPTTGNMTHSGAAIAGIDADTNFGTLSTVAGAVTKIAFTTQPGDTTYGSILSPQPVIKTQDQFGNDSTSGLSASKIIAITLTGTGNLQGTTSLDIGTAAGNGTATFTDLAVNQVSTGNKLAATTAGLTPALSNEFAINKKTLTATVSVNGKAYDGNNTAVITGVSLDDIVPGDTVTADFSGATATFDDANARPGKTVTATGVVLVGSAAGNYSIPASVTGTANITALPISVTADAGKTKVYGDTDPVFTYTITSGSLIGSDSLSGSLSRVTGENVGTYAINQGTLTNSNYDITFISHDFNITPKPITVTAITNTKVYDGNATATAIPTNSSLVSGDTANFTETYNNENVGTSKILTPSGTVNDGNGGNNYSYTFVTNTTGVITQKNLTISGLSAADKVYDATTDAVISGTPALVGNVVGDDISLAGSAVGTFNTPNVGSNSVTISGLSLTGADAGNYTLTQPTLTATITAKSITITPTPGQTKVYGSSDPAFAYTSAPALLGSDSFSGALGRADGKNIGAYAYNLETLSAGSNYSLTLSPDVFSITTKPLTVSAAGNNKTYNASAVATVNLSSSDIVSGDTVALNYTSANFADKNVGIGKTINVSGISITGVDSSNYALQNTTASANANITQAPLTATITASNKVYDGGVSATITGRALSGVIGGDVVTPNASGAATFSNKNVGDLKLVSATDITLAGADKDNYSYDGTASGSANITQKPLTVSAAGNNKTYNASAVATVNLSSSDIVSGDTVTLNYSSASFDAGKNVGVGKAISIGGIGIAGDDASNYALQNTTVSANANITQAPLTITITVADKVYDGATSAIITGRAPHGVFSGDDITVDANGVAVFENAAVGNNKPVSASGITLSGSDVSNYSYDNSASGTGNILPIPIAVYVDDNYSIGNAGTHTFEYDAFNTIQAGISAVDVGGTVNVATGTYNGNLLIEKKLLLIGATGTKPVINGNAGTNYIVKINDADGVVIDNFEINGGGSATGANAFDYGILVNNSGSDTDSNRVEINNSVVRNIWKNGSNGIDIADSSYALIHNNTISSFHKRGIRYTNSAGKVYDNEIIGDNVDGTSRVQNLVNLWGGSTVEIYGNELHNALTTGETPTWDSPAIFISSYGGNGASIANIRDNEIYACDTGVVVGSSYADTDTSSANITHNNFHNLSTAINFEKNTVTAVIHTNKFVNNIKSVDANGITGPASTDAERNWWGSASGPVAGVVYEGVDYRPWCTEETCAVTDSLAPTVFISSDAGILTNTSPIPIAVHFSEAVTDFGSADVFVGNGVASAVSGSGADYTFSIVPSGQGSVTVDIHANAAWDAVGNYNTAATQFSITYDTVASDVTLTNAPSSPTSEISANITVGGEGVATYKYKLDEGSYGSFVSVETHITLSGLTDGEHTLLVIGKDTAGNEQTVATSAAWTVDTEASTAVLTGSPANPTNATGGTITVGGEGVIAYKYKLDGEDYGDETVIATPIALSGLTAGSHTLSVIAKDAAGNWQETATTHTWTIDTTAPILDSHTPSVNAVGISPLANITISFNEPVNVEDTDVTITGGVAKTITGSGSAAITINPDASLADNTTFTVTLNGITDLAGNTLGDYFWSFTTSGHYSIPLAYGWNLISLPVVPNDTDIADVLGANAANIVSVFAYDAKTGDWNAYHPNEPNTGDLQIMTAGYAYWINYGGSVPGTLEGSGNLLLEGNNPPPERKLASGWNLIGYYQRENTTSVSASNALANSLNTYWTLLAKYNNQSSSFSFLNANSQLNPGEGYWIFLNGVGGTEYNYTIGNIPD